MRFPTVLLALAACGLIGNAHAEEYSFSIHNNSGSKIVRVQVSEDGNSWGDFNIGSGIAAGATSELIWDQSTNDGGCEWLFAATFADGSTSDPESFDFCEDDLVIEFE